MKQIALSDGGGVGGNSLSSLTFQAGLLVFSYTWTRTYTTDSPVLRPSDLDREYKSFCWLCFSGELWQGGLGVGSSPDLCFPFAGNNWNFGQTAFSSLGL